MSKAPKVNYQNLVAKVKQPLNDITGQELTSLCEIPMIIQYIHKSDYSLNVIALAEGQNWEET